ncbi:disulfide oxidoreductase [Bacillus sp. MUM 13]|uniref:disulfide oxidoreductase n=1 Tax=Bacillus sp. MUM 13 TaxID=1678001 RepID=UPI0008F5A50E|nr:disulfide oxidoreductase [Bacillus sp. MUM 13]OIK12122.1 disulfide bond formation protein DsbB [Bacillus sp. MUM 13]
MNFKKGNKDYLLFLAWISAIIAMFGSLYFSEIKHFEPCKLCWYQRILMYPLTVLLGAAVVKKDYPIVFYTMMLSGIGMFLSAYHFSIQKIPFFTEHVASCGRVSCTSDYINWFGFVTIPLLALIGFVIIFTSSAAVWKLNREAAS